MESSNTPHPARFPASLLAAEDEALLLPEGDILRGADRAFHLAVQADLAFMGYILAAERRNIPKSEGFESTEGWVTSRYGIGFGAACTKVNAARCLANLPLIRGAYTEGRISWDHVRALVEIAGPESERDLLEVCEGTTAGYTWKMVIQVKKVSAQDSIFAREARYLEKQWDMVNRQLMVSGQLPEDLGMAFEKALDTIAAGLPDEPGYTKEQRQADALVQMATDAAGAGGDRALVVVHVNHSDLATGEGNGHFESGPSTSIQTVEAMMCDSPIQVVVDNAEGKPIGIGHRSRRTPRWLRRQLMNRDKTCRFGSCRNKNRLEAHHITSWPAGPTDYDNLVMLCKLHHDKVHHEGWVLKGNAPKVWFMRADGRAVKVGPPPRDADLTELFVETFFDDRVFPSAGSARDPTCWEP